jgi:hypothetical protein
MQLETEECLCHSICLPVHPPRKRRGEQNGSAYVCEQSAVNDGEVSDEEKESLEDFGL